MGRLRFVGAVVLVALLAWVVLYRPSPLGVGSPLARGQIVDVTIQPPVIENCISDTSEVPELEDVPVDERPPFCRGYEAVGISVGNGDTISLDASVTDARVMRRLAGGLAYWPMSATALEIGQTAYVWGNGLAESNPPQTDATVVEVR